MRKTVFTEKAPRPVGPYSQAIVCKNVVYCSGQLGIDPSNGKIVDGGSAEQAKRCLENLKEIVESAGSSMDRVIRCTIFVTDLDDFKAVNEVYSKYFSIDPPARTTVQVARLPLGAKVEIDAMAEL